MMLSTRALLNRNPEPSRAEIQEALSGNLCRCTGTQIVQAVETAVAQACGKPAPSRRGNATWRRTDSWHPAINTAPSRPGAILPGGRQTPPQGGWAA
ncbi:MAG: 2Fe-2S iron-sulfur cluster-binding protein [Planctomycetota bacterium]